MYLKLFLFALLIVGIAIAGIAIKMFVFKGGEFKKQCSSVDAQGRRMGCGCGAKEGSCDNRQASHSH